MAAPLYYSADMVRDLIDESRPWPRYETVYGELLVTPAPRPWHQAIVIELLGMLRDYLKAEPVGRLFAAPADISWGADHLVQPDVFVVQQDEARTMDWTRMKTLLLAVEILSPSTTRNDRFTKRRLYQEAGVPLYWIVDGEGQCVDVWTPDAKFPQIEHERLVWHPAGVSAPFALQLAELFKSV
ncbi:MAG: Uma2 family endonuclease [Gemmatimonadaceae bacterium]